MLRLLLCYSLLLFSRKQILNAWLDLNCTHALPKLPFSISTLNELNVWLEKQECRNTVRRVLKDACTECYRNTKIRWVTGAEKNHSFTKTVVSEMNLRGNDFFEGRETACSEELIFPFGGLERLMEPVSIQTILERLEEDEKPVRDRRAMQYDCQLCCPTRDDYKGSPGKTARHILIQHLICISSYVKTSWKQW